MEGTSKAKRMPFLVKVSQGFELSQIRGPKQPQFVMPFAVIPYRYIAETAMIKTEVTSDIKRGRMLKIRHKPKKVSAIIRIGAQNPNHSAPY